MISAYFIYFFIIRNNFKYYSFIFAIKLGIMYQYSKEFFKRIIKQFAKTNKKKKLIYKCVYPQLLCIQLRLFERNVQGVLIQITLWLSDILIIIIRYRSIFNISMKYTSLHQCVLHPSLYSIRNNKQSCPFIPFLPCNFHLALGYFPRLSMTVFEIIVVCQILISFSIPFFPFRLFLISQSSWNYFLQLLPILLIFRVINFFFSIHIL